MDIRQSHNQKLLVDVVVLRGAAGSLVTIFPRPMLDFGIYIRCTGISIHLRRDVRSRRDRALPYPDTIALLPALLD